MLIVKFWGGLGNQLFIYGLYSELKKKGKKVKADISNYNGTDIREFILEDLGIKLDYVSESDYFNIQKSFSDKITFIKHKLKKRDYKYFNAYYEKGKPFEKEVFEADNKCLLGYWQDPKYFESSADEVRKSITLPYDKNNKNFTDLLEEVSSGNSVSVHVRLTDYLTLTTNGMGKVCDMEYYKKAISTVCEKLASPKFYIFSDDIELAKKMFSESNIDASAFTYIEPHGTTDDMYLMSKCQHHIIANSSYSWWAAWLSDNTEDDSIVVAPKIWDPTRTDWNINLDKWTKI